MQPADKESPGLVAATVAAEAPEGTISRAVRWNPSDLERVERAAEVLSARERLNITAADLIRRGAMREADAILGEAPATEPRP